MSAVCGRRSIAISRRPCSRRCGARATASGSRTRSELEASEPARAHGEELFPPLLSELRSLEAEKRAQRRLHAGAERRDGARGLAVRAAERLPYSFFAHAQPLQVLRRELQSVRGVLSLLGAPPQDRGAALGRN